VDTAVRPKQVIDLATFMRRRSSSSSRRRRRRRRR